MIAPGSKWSLRLKFPHRIEATVVDLGADYIVTTVNHRCGFSCPIDKMLSGEVLYRYADFYALFVPMAVDAIALHGGVS